MLLLMLLSKTQGFIEMELCLIYHSLEIVSNSAYTSFIHACVLVALLTSLDLKY